MGDEADSLWGSYWQSLQREWFKLEVLQDYYAEDKGPSLDAWLAGDKRLSLKLMSGEADQEFIAMCRDKVSKGVNLLRIHLVEHPLTPYLEWEIEHYKKVNQRLAGERVFLADKNGLGSIKIPSGDLMIFDSQKAVVNTYDSEGRMAAETFYDQPGELEPWLKIQRQAMKTAKPLGP
jgi:hypothetical protein